MAQTDLQPIVNEAITLWSQAGLSAAEVQKLRQVQFVVTDLRGAQLGETDGNIIYLDANAAGNGWFIDPTPASNQEFSTSVGSSQLQAVDPRALDRIDLLTVVEHELGHIAGLSDLDALADNVMTACSAAGVAGSPRLPMRRWPRRAGLGRRRELLRPLNAPLRWGLLAAATTSSIEHALS